MAVTMEQVLEYFTKVNCDTKSKDELCEEIWNNMSADERQPYFEELEELNNGK